MKSSNAGGLTVSLKNQGHAHKNLQLSFHFCKMFSSISQKAFFCAVANWELQGIHKYVNSMLQSTNYYYEKGDLDLLFWSPDFLYGFTY